MYVLVPSHDGFGETTGPVGVNVTPQLSITVGGTGTTSVLFGHATVDEPSAGSMKSLYSIVYV